MHDVPGEHDHDDDALYEQEEEHPLWKLDTITLTSVGIDVGTATSQIIFSKLVLRRLGLELSSRFVVTERTTLYRSPVWFTPYTPNRERIDDAALERLIDESKDGETVGVFTSGGPVCVGAAWVLGLDDVKAMELTWMMRNASMTELLYPTGRLVLGSFNALPRFPSPDMVTYV